MVALRTLCGLFDPRVLVRMSCTPAASSTGRTAPPAMTPVPGTAGLRKTRPAPERHEDQILLRVLDRFPDGLRHFVGLAEADANVSSPVAHDDQRREREAPAALDDLGHAVDRDHPVIQLQHARIDPRSRHSYTSKADQQGPD